MNKIINLDKVKREKPIQDLLRFGIINIDKPSGPTSFSVSNYVCKELKINKTSHQGTLDPMVSGVLPVLLGRACRLSDYFMHKNKKYIGIMRLHADIDEKVLRETIKKFIGKIMQMPPVRSRVKRALREREVLSFNILEIEGKDVLFETEVQAGTYIRTICDNIGKDLNIGAHMLELRRIKAGIFDESKIYNLYDFNKAVQVYKEGDENPLREMIVPAEIISTFMPVIEINDKKILKQLLTGKPLMKSDTKDKIPKEEKFCIFNDETFIGVYQPVKERDIIARTEFVFN